METKRLCTVNHMEGMERDMNNNTVNDTVELVKDFADRADLIRQIEELKYHIQLLKEDKAMLQGEVNGLRFAIRCNGVSGSEVSMP